MNVGSDTLHFALNKYQIEDNDRMLLGRQATWLNNNTRSVRVRIEGHCDERGTREYNLALGARRANAVKEYLAAAGKVSRLGALIPSPMAKSGPSALESNEACWSQNRRGVTTIIAGAATS